MSQTVGAAPLAIASITAVLRDLLANGLIRYASVMRLGDVNVSVLPPDRITVGSEEPNQINVFMYGVAPHSRRTITARSCLGVSCTSWAVRRC
jgi:hypothetical protein